MLKEKRKKPTEDIFFFNTNQYGCILGFKHRITKGCFTFTAGWSEVVHQEAKEVVELQKIFTKNFKRKKDIFAFSPFFLR